MDFNKDELINKIDDDSFITEVAERFFRYYDKDKNNQIGKKELIRAMKDISRTFYGCEPEASAIETQFQKLDKDRSKGIDFNEFRTFIRNYIKMLIEF